MVQAGGEDVITALMEICNKIWQRWKWPTSWNQSLVITLRQPAAVSELPNDQPHQPPKQSHAEDHTEQIEATSREDHRWRTGRLQSRKHHGADLQLANPVWEIPPAPTGPLPCLHRLQEGFRQGLACNFVDRHEEEQHQRQTFQSSKASITRPPVQSP